MAKNSCLPPTYCLHIVSKSQLCSLPAIRTVHVSFIHSFFIHFQKTHRGIITPFLGIHLDNHLNWKDHIDQIIPKLNAACYAVRQMYHFVNQNTLKSIYFAYFHSIVKYGTMFWGNSSNSRNIFTLQKKIIRIMVGGTS
jgi:hypothetical protein